MRILSGRDIKDWASLLVTVRRGWPMSASAYRELVRLNHLVMETSGDIHNDNMMGSNQVKRLN